MSPGDRRDELSRVLLRVVAERGIEGATIRGLAEAAGVSIGAVQHHFATKDELLLAAFSQTGTDLTERAERVARRALTARAAIRGILLELLPLDEQRTAEARIGIAFAARAMASPPLAARLTSDLDALRAALAEAYAAGHVADPTGAASRAMALADGLTTQLLFAGETAPTADDAVAAIEAQIARDLDRRGRRR